MTLTDALRTIPEFADLSNAELQALEHSMVDRTYPDGYVFFEEGDKGDSVYLLIEGEVAVTHTEAKGHGPIVIRRLHAGDLFGIIALIGRDRRTATCTSVGQVRATSLPLTAFQLLYQMDSPISHHFQRVVARQVMRDYRSLVDTLDHLIFMPPDERQAEIARTLKSVILEYTGPERRKGERRRG